MKQKKRNVHSGQSGERKLGLDAAAGWPVFECLVSECWRDTTTLTEILIAKEPPFGGIVACVFLVDLGCLGPKNGFVTQFRTIEEYKTIFRTMMTGRNPKISTDYALAVKIIRESIRYARDLGFDVPQTVQKTLSALGSLNVASKCHEEIPLGGKDGRPFYMCGPQDDINKIMDILVRKCGHGNFTFTIAQNMSEMEYMST